MPAVRQAGQGAAATLCTGHVDALFAGSMRVAPCQRRVSRQHAIIRLDVMRPVSKTLTALLLACLVAWRRRPCVSGRVGGARAAQGASRQAEQAGQEKPPKPKAKPRRRARRQQDGGPARGRRTAPAAGLRPGPARWPRRPSTSPATMRRSRRSAISPSPREDAASLREAMAAAAGSRVAGCQGPARQDRRPGRPQARRLVSLPWRIWHGDRRFAPSSTPIRPGPTAAC